MNEEVTEVMRHLDTLEEFYNNDYLDLKTYYEIKGNILLRYISIGEYYKEELKEKLGNDEGADY